MISEMVVVIGEHIFKVGICSHFKTYWNVILFAVVPDHSHGKSLTDAFPALVPDPADGHGNGKDFDFHCSSRHKTEKDINILTYTAGGMAFMGSADTRQAGSS